MKEKEKVAIIILNFNGKNFTKNCLNSIKKNTEYKNYFVILVDNNSNDGSQKLIESQFRWVDLIKNKQNRGFSGGNNDGIIYAIKKYNPDYFYLLNNDTLVERGWLTNAINCSKKSNKIGIVGSKQFNFEKKPAISAGWITSRGVKYYWGNKEKEVNWLSGAGFLIKKEVIKKITGKNSEILVSSIKNPLGEMKEKDWKTAFNKIKLLKSITKKYKCSLNLSTQLKYPNLLNKNSDLKNYTCGIFKGYNLIIYNKCELPFCCFIKLHGEYNLSRENLLKIINSREYILIRKMFKKYGALPMCRMCCALKRNEN